ncbi:unnamed protein product [Prorocentrum cordatum]|uniref:Uncharacterized protein n=1 Tax=Prorocentrum cordatum TaxID=2364126 RepID=A0ABN9TQ19_9DINO|nr:unnamed protein product [Polarella glacialis]
MLESIKIYNQFCMRAASSAPTWASAPTFAGRNSRRPFPPPTPSRSDPPSSSSPCSSTPSPAGSGDTWVLIVHRCHSGVLSARAAAEASTGEAQTQEAALERGWQGILSPSGRAAARSRGLHRNKNKRSTAEAKLNQRALFKSASCCCSFAGEAAARESKADSPSRVKGGLPKPASLRSDRGPAASPRWSNH